MKIYCTRTSFTLDFFEGKELWVRCLKQSSGNPNVWYRQYIRVKHLSRLEEPLVGVCIAYNAIPVEFLEESYSVDYDGAVAISYLLNNDSYEYVLDGIKIVEPIDMMTTEEIVDMLLSRGFPMGDYGEV